MPHGASANTYSELAPVLAEHCIMCHSGDAAPLGLRLDSLNGILKGGARGPVVKAGDPAGSELIRRLRGTNLPRMPMTGPPYLSEPQIALFERWITNGLPVGDHSKAPNAALPAPSRPASGAPVTYRHVAPIFATRCAKCHTDNGLMGAQPPEGLRLTSYEATLSSTDRARVVPGIPGASELLRRIRGHAKPRMPFDGPPFLTSDEIRLIEDWIQQGARDASGTPAPIPAGARVRLHGTLGSGWKIDDLPLDLSPRTRIDKAPAPGDYVEVRGQLDANGNVIVERLRRR